MIDNPIKELANLLDTSEYLVFVSAFTTNGYSLTTANDAFKRYLETLTPNILVQRHAVKVLNGDVPFTYGKFGVLLA